MLKSYHQQFRDDQRNKNHRGVVFKSKATAGKQSPPQRPTAVAKQAARSNTFTLPKEPVKTDSKVPKVKQTPNGAPRQPAKGPASISESLDPVKKSRSSMRQNGSIRSTTRQTNTATMDQRRPVRFASNHNDVYYSPPPASFPARHDPSDRSRSMRVTNDDYVIHRRKDPAAHAYTDHHRTVSEIPTISYTTSLPPITQPMHSTPPMIIIRPQETFQPEPPPFMPSMSTVTSYPPNPYMFYPPDPSMMFPPGPMPGQPFNQPFFFPPTMDPNYFSQSYLYPIPFSLPPPVPPPPPPPPPAPQPTIVNQSSSSASASVATAAPINYQTITEAKPPTIVFRPHSSTYDRKNLTIQLKMADEVCPVFSRAQEIDHWWSSSSAPKILSLPFSGARWANHPCCPGSSLPSTCRWSLLHRLRSDTGRLRAASGPSSDDRSPATDTRICLRWWSPFDSSSSSFSSSWSCLRWQRSTIAVRRGNYSCGREWARSRLHLRWSSQTSSPEFSQSETRGWDEHRLSLNRNTLVGIALLSVKMVLFQWTKYTIAMSARLRWNKMRILKLIDWQTSLRG